MNYYIFRHGTTYHTKNNMEYGKEILSSEILPEGIPAIERLAEYLKSVETDYNVSSEILRAKQTARIVSNISGKEFEFDKRLNELMEPPASINPKIYPFTETLDEMTRRVHNFLNEIKKSNYKNVLICTHGGPIAAIKHLIVNGSFDRKDLADFPPPGVLVVIRSGVIEEIDFK